MLSRARISLLFMLSVTPFASCDCEVEPLQGVPGRVAGILCDGQTGLPTSGIALEIAAANGETITGATDATGSFLVDGVPTGDATVTFGNRTIDIVVTSGATTQLSDPACRDVPPGPGFGDIIGTVCNRHTGALVSDATVTVPLDESQGGNMTTTTDSEGNFQLWNVPVGPRVVTVVATGFQRTWAVDVAPGEVVEIISDASCVSPGLEQGMLSGVFCAPDTAGEPLVEGRVVVTDAEDSDYSELTDASGAFILGPMAPGLARVTVEKDGAIVVDVTAVVVAGQETQVTNGGGCVVETCQETAIESDGRTELLFVVDRSGSMNFGAPGYDGTRWEGVVGAMQTVSVALQQRIAFGLSMYPSLESNECGTTSPQIAPDFDNGDEVSAMLGDFFSAPAGATPTASALRSVKEWHLANPTDRKRALLLATDGAPNCNSSLDPATCVCSSPGDARCSAGGDAYMCLDDAASVAAVAELSALGLDTYIIGIPGVENFGYVLDQMAAAGNSTRHYVARDYEALEAAVVDIARRAGGCTVEITDLELSDVARVDIVIDGESVPHDPEQENGYAMVDEHHVELYGAACENYLTAGAAELGLCTIDGGDQ
jgi:hypothetical protein